MEEASAAPAGTLQEVLEFRQEVADEIGREEALVKKVKQHPLYFDIFHPLAYALLVFMFLIIIYNPLLLIPWVIVGLLLYSYNFIILLIPTTASEKVTVKERTDFEVLYRQFRELFVHLILRRKRLAAEVGMTLFLGGMVPLAVPFFLILGMGLFFAVLFGFITHSIAEGVASVIILQTTVILAFYALMTYLEPQSQGISKFASKLRIRLGRARFKGRRALTFIIIVIAGLVTLTIVVFIGAILLPGETLIIVTADFKAPGVLNVPIMFSILCVQALIMRHFQGITSRNIAVELLNTRIEKLRKDVLEPVDEWSLQANDPDASHYCIDMNAVKGLYYSIVMYDIVEQNIFGFAPIYLIAPKIKLIHNEKILAYVTPAKADAVGGADT
jgi:hypothetical protein